MSVSSSFATKPESNRALGYTRRKSPGRLLHLRLWRYSHISHGTRLLELAVPVRMDVHVHINLTLHRLVKNCGNAPTCIRLTNATKEDTCALHGLNSALWSPGQYIPDITRYHQHICHPYAVLLGPIRMTSVSQKLSQFSIPTYFGRRLIQPSCFQASGQGFITWSVLLVICFTRFPFPGTRQGTMSECLLSITFFTCSHNLTASFYLCSI